NWSANLKTDLFSLKEWIGIACVSAETWIRGQIVVAIKIEPASVKIFAASARHDVDRAIAGHACCQIEVNGRKLKLLHRFLGNLQRGAGCTNEIDVRAVYSKASVSDARRVLRPCAKHR